MAPRERKLRDTRKRAVVRVNLVMLPSLRATVADKPEHVRYLEDLVRWYADDTGQTVANGNSIEPDPEDYDITPEFARELERILTS